MAYNEGVIRDFLAQDLAIIEPGLQLIEKEYYLPNNVGSKGFIDILARDKHGLLVVIELKRSDGAARQCIHELFKYAGLLGKNHGVRLDQLRCIAISTEWHELLLPFSELYHSGNFQLSGYKLIVNKDGKPLAMERVEPVPPQSGLEICPEHTVFLFANEERRGAGLKRLQENLADFGISDYILVELDYAKNESKIIYPFGLFFALPVIGFVDQASLHKRVQDSFDEDCSYPIEMAISVAIQDELDFDDVEISYPDKFVYILSDETWLLGSWYNAGAFRIGLLRPPEAVLAEVAGFDSGQGTSFYKTISPANHIAWVRFMQNLDLHVNWCEGWKLPLSSFLNEVSASSSVSVSIHAPDDLLSVMHKVFVEGDPSCLPAMEVIVSDGTEVTDVLIGYLGWDGLEAEGSLSHFVRDTYESFESYRWIQHFDEQRDYESVTCEFFGVQYTALKMEGQEEVSMRPLDLAAYRRVNAKVLEELRSVFESFPIVNL